MTCYHCGILGHIERDCRKKQRGVPRVTVPGAPPPPAALAPPLLPTPFASQVLSAQSSSATDQQSSASPSPADRQLLAMFRNFQQFHMADSSSSYGRATSLHHSPPPPHVTRVRIADGTLLPVSSIGHLSTSTFSVPAALVYT